MKKLKSIIVVLLTLLAAICVLSFASFAAANCPLCGSNLTGEEKKTEATCTEPAYQILVCSNPKCEGKKNAQGSALGHDWVEVIDKKYVKDPAYCSGPATYYKSCSRCKASAKDNANAAKLVFNGPAEERDSSIHRNFENCVIQRPATCTKTGVYASGVCLDCGVSLAGCMIPMLPHEPKIPANCVDQAVCCTCGQSYGEVDKTQHKSIVKDISKYPSCTSIGVISTAHCEACMETVHIPTEIIPATGHTWGNWKTFQSTTPGENGIDVRFCSVCGAYELRESGKAQPQPTTKADNASGNQSNADNGSFFQRMLQWFRDLLSKLLGR